MRLLSAIVSSLVFASSAACVAPASEEAAASSEAQTTEAAPLLDCARPGSFPEQAMLALPGSYERDGRAPADAMQTLTIGPLADISGWAGKSASYTRDVIAPCKDIVALGDGSGLTKDSELPMTSAACAGQTGKVTTLMDNPALGAFLSLEDASGLPFGKDFYFVSSSVVKEGKLVAMCLVNGGTGDTFLMKRKEP